MFKLLELIGAYYLVGLLISYTRGVPESEMGYNSFMWGVIVYRRLYKLVQSYVARYQNEHQEDLKE